MAQINCFKLSDILILWRIPCVGLKKDWIFDELKRRLWALWYWLAGSDWIFKGFISGSQVDSNPGGPHAF